MLAPGSHAAVHHPVRLAVVDEPRVAFGFKFDKSYSSSPELRTKKRRVTETDRC